MRTLKRLRVLVFNLWCGAGAWYLARTTIQSSFCWGLVTWFYFLAPKGALEMQMSCVCLSLSQSVGPHYALMLLNLSRVFQEFPKSLPRVSQESFKSLPRVFQESQS